MKNLSYIVIVVGLGELFVVLLLIAKLFALHIHEQWTSWVYTLLVTLVGTFLGAALAVWLGWKAYVRQQGHQRGQLVAALLFETGQNQALLNKVIEGGEWNATSVGASFPRATVAESALAQPFFYRSDTDRGLVIAATHYREQVEAVRRTMTFMYGRFEAQAGLSEVNVATLKRISGNALAASYALQTLLDEYSERHALRVGGKEQVEHYRRVLQEQRKLVGVESDTGDPPKEPAEGAD